MVNRCGLNWTGRFAMDEITFSVRAAVILAEADET
jgi:hypothetical protein